MTEDYGRRKWQVVGDAPKKKTKEKPEDELESVVLPNERTETLKARQHNLKLEAKVGKTLTIAKDTTGGGVAKGKSPFYCGVCEVDFNDSHSFVDHLNGKRHNRILGMNMKVEAVSVERIRDKLEMLSKRGPTRLDEKSVQKATVEKKNSEHEENGTEEMDEEEGEEEEDDETDIAMAAMGLPTKLK